MLLLNTAPCIILPVIDPGSDSQPPQSNTFFGQAPQSWALLSLELQQHQGQAGDGEEEEAEGIHNLYWGYQADHRLLYLLTGCINPKKVVRKARKMKMLENLLLPSERFFQPGGRAD